MEKSMFLAKLKETELNDKIVEIKESDSKVKFEEGPTLIVPDINKRTESVSSQRSVSSMKPAHWFARRARRSRNNTDSTTRSRTDTINSGVSNGSDNHLEDKKIGRSKSVMRGLAKRGRTVRRNMKAALHINEADSLTSHDGHVMALTGEQRLRMYVLKEILETEDDYTKLLQFIIDVMIPELNNCVRNKDMTSVTNDVIGELLSNIQEIHQLHIKFSASLKEVLYPYPYYTNCIGNIFIKYKEEFKAYGEYCANFTNAQRVSYKLENDGCIIELIDKWKDSVATKSRNFLHLEGFIISPVQRLCKYPLLLRELKKFTMESHPDAKSIAEAAKVMEEVTASVNETERRAITLQAIRDVDNAFDSWEKSGCLSKHGFMVKRGGSVKTWNIRWFILNNYVMKYYNEPTDQTPLGTLDLTAYKSFEENATEIAGRPNCFGIKMPDRTYYIYTVTELEKSEWISILRWKFDCIDRQRKQAHRPLETVIFSSLSSFLHPKGLIESNGDENGTVKKKEKIVEKIEPIVEAKAQPKKKRSKSFLRLSFSRKHRQKENKQVVKTI